MKDMTGGDHAEAESGSPILFVPSRPDKEAEQRVLEAIANNNDTDDNNDEGIMYDSLHQQWPVTCQVKIDTIGSGWLLTSLDSNGNPKTKGGDEYYIAFTANKMPADEGDPVVRPYTAVALIDDLRDGSYRLDFSATPACPVPPEEPLGGMLTIYFQYSCGIGKMAPTSKKKWTNGGYTHKRYDVQLSTNPPISPFTGPDIRYDLSQFDLLAAFGDSTMEQLVRQRPNKKGKYFFQSNVTLGQKVSTGLNSRTVIMFVDMLENCLGALLRDAMNYPKRAILIGSCLWDILDSKDTLQGEGYADHVQACREYIQHIRERFPDVRIVWKSPMAVHIHVVDVERLVVSKIGEAALFGTERIRYMSASRSKSLHIMQKQIMQEHGQVWFLDLYKATYLSADWLFPSDGRHYRPDLNRLMLSWFYPSFDAIFKTGIIVNSDGKGGKLMNIAKPYFSDPTHGIVCEREDTYYPR